MQCIRVFLLYFFVLILALVFVVTSSLTEANINNMHPSIMSQMRVELFFKGPIDLKDKVNFLRSHGISKFNLVNKNKGDPMEEWIAVIREVYPEADVCAHYSLKYNKIPRNGIHQQEQRFLEMMANTRAQEVLLVSGSGKTTTWNTVQVLKTVKNAGSFNSAAQLAIAYNPFFPNPKDQEDENNRLKEKLASGCVDKIYLQFGSNLQRLKRGLQFCQSTAAAYSPHKNVAIAGSLFLPTAKLIAQQKFRPWNGVFLSPEFLSGSDNACSIIVEIMKIYQTYNVEFLWEAPGIRTEKDIGLVFDLLVKIEDQCHGNSATNPPGNDEAVDNDDRVAKRSKPSLESNQEIRSTDPCILIFGSHDVRLQDNLALDEACRQHMLVLPVFLWTKEDREAAWGVQGALRVILKDALCNLESSLKSFGMPLICCCCGNISDHGTSELMELIEKTKAKAVFWNRECTPEGKVREAYRKDQLQKENVGVYEFQSSLLYDPYRIDLAAGFRNGHFATLMPFLKYCREKFGEPHRPTPFHETFRLLESTRSPDLGGGSFSVDNLELAVITGSQKWDEPIRERFRMSEQVAHDAMDAFVRNGLKKYESQRSRADLAGATSELSPHLRIGTLSPNHLYWRIEDSGLSNDKLKTFSRRLFWRDLAYYQLSCFPYMRHRCIRSHYEEMEWVGGAEEERRFRAWKRGRTGFPIVDAAMRELYSTGWMTQSIRMVAASFLVEYLRVNWTKGCEWFHYTLADSDSAINSMMWQNAGKSGIDQVSLTYDVTAIADTKS
jgi:deoxyribodipyrimidine photolyase